MHPLLARRIILPLHERLLGRPSFRLLRELHETQWWSPAQIRRLQTDKLRAVVRHAHERCPYYRRRFREAGVDIDTLDLDSLTGLPTLSRRDVGDHAEEMVDRSVRGGLHRMSTGGSTGVPVRFYVDRLRQAADWAARARARSWFGIEPGEREIYLWGSPIEHTRQDRLKDIRDRLANHRLLNAFRMTPRNMTRYVDAIARFDPVHIFGYPSSLARLVRHAGTMGRRVGGRSLRAVFVTGEVFEESDRALVEDAVGVPVAEEYGARDAGFIAHQCPAGVRHVTMESLIVELLDDDGRRVADGERGEVTVTHLDAFGMPFVRYRTGDLARRRRTACRCGRGLESLERIEGRRTDMLRTTDGGHAHALSAIYVLRDESPIDEFRVRQRANLDLEVSIVSRAGLDSACEDRIRRRLRQQIGEAVEVRINQVAEIPPEPSGKHRYVVSEAVEPSGGQTKARQSVVSSSGR